MNHKHINTHHIMTAPIKQSLAAVRSAFFTEAMVDFLIEKQVQEFSKIRKKYPEIKRNEAIKISILNAAYQLKEDKDKESYCLGNVKKVKKSPQFDWLKLHRSFVLKLHNDGASLREIAAALLYRFHHKVSHTIVAAFLKIEES